MQVPNETFKAAAHLVVSGKKRRFPNVKIILAHLGGVTPFLAARVAVLSRYMGCPLSHEEILEDFKTFYYDTALSTHETTLAAMQTFVGANRILFGSDFPGMFLVASRRIAVASSSVQSTAVSVDIVQWFSRNADAFYASDNERRDAIMCRNAEVLLNL